MKALHCMRCGDIIAPLPVDNVPRYCDCRSFAVWWRDGSRGRISVHAMEESRRYMRDDVRKQAVILGIHNGWLMDPQPHTAEKTRAICAAAEGHLFKTYDSPIVRFAPGATNDSRWEVTLPDDELVTVVHEETEILRVPKRWGGNWQMLYVGGYLGNLNIELHPVDEARTAVRVVPKS